MASPLVKIAIYHDGGWWAELEEDGDTYETENPVFVLRRLALEIENDQTGKAN